MRIKRWLSVIYFIAALAPYAIQDCAAQETTARIAIFPLVSPIPKRCSQTIFEDRSINIEFMILTQLSFKLINKSTSPIELDWDRAAFVDMGGATHRVFHKGIRLMERDRAQPPTVIPAGASLADFAHPVDYVEYANGKWETHDLLPLLKILTEKDRYQGKSIKFLLPLTIGSVKKSYEFVFMFPKTPPVIKYTDSDGVGLSRSDWDQQHGSPTESDRYQSSYEGGRYIAKFEDENIRHLEYTWGNNNAVSLETARSHAKLLMPHDSKFLRTYIPREARLVDLYSSESLKTRFISAAALPGCEFKSPWIGGKPGEFLVLYRMDKDRVTSIVIAIGNNP